MRYCLPNTVTCGQPVMVFVFTLQGGPPLLGRLSLFCAYLCFLEISSLWIDEAVTLLADALPPLL